MPSLIVEGIKKVSVAAAFLFHCLVSEIYPSCLVWEDSDNLTCWLECIHKKKTGYKSEVEKMFQEYIVFKTRNSIANDQGKRSVMLQAIKASPYVEIDKNLSTADKKFIRFTEKFKKLLNSLMQENTSEVSNRESENSLISTNDANMPESSYQSVEDASETASSVPDVDMADSFEEVSSSFYSESGSSIRFIPQEGLLPNGSVNLPGLEQPTPLPRLEQSVHFPGPGQSTMLRGHEQSAPPLEIEQPTYLPLNEESSVFCPPDYDPLEDLLRSQRAIPVSPHNSLDIHVNSPNRAQLPFEIHDVRSVKIEGNRVFMLPYVGPSSSQSPTHYMVSIRNNEQ